MKKENLQRILPYEADYNLLSKCRKWEIRGLWMVSICSILLSILKYFSNIYYITIILNIANYINYLLIVAYYILNVYTETFLYPATARKRRKGFIDNSLGSKYLEKSVDGYYTNDVINVGPYKMIVNCGENCYFTMNIAKAMVPQVVIKNVILFTLFLTFAYFGIKNNSVALPILQIFLSSMFLTELVHHINFVTKLEQLFERFKTAFSKAPESIDTLQESVLLYLDYETTLAYNKAPLSDSIYEKLNEKLSKEWEDVKTRYEIQ